MSKVTYGQHGYIDTSMSARAREAYENGEAPKSKWTKAAMLAAIKNACWENDRLFDPAIEKLRKDDIFDQFMEYTGWHHTGKFMQETAFYAVDEDAVLEVCRPLSDEEAENWELERIVKAALLAAVAAQQQKEAEEREARYERAKS